MEDHAVNFPPAATSAKLVPANDPIFDSMKLEPELSIISRRFYANKLVLKFGISMDDSIKIINRKCGGVPAILVPITINPNKKKKNPPKREKKVKLKRASASGHPSWLDPIKQDDSSELVESTSPQVEKLVEMQKDYEEYNAEISKDNIYQQGYRVVSTLLK